jgi:hypothetical protein
MKRSLRPAQNSRREKQPFRRFIPDGALVLSYVLAVSSLASSSTAQKPPNPTLVGPTQSSPASLDQTNPVTPIAKRVSISLTPAQMPPLPPHVSYVDGQLTILAENCSLGDILAAVRRLTGVEIDLPVGASDERMAAKLGPAPQREVLTALLSSTDYNYVVQAADDAPNEVQSILLMPRDKSSPKARDSGSPSAGPRRRASRKSDVTAVTAEESSEAEIPVSSQALVGEEPPHSNLQPAPTDTPSDSVTQADLKPAPSTPAAEAVQPTLSPTEQMMQGMQRLYEQRKEMTQQQNPENAKQTSTN